MKNWKNSSPERVWHVLYDVVASILQNAGRKYEAGRGDWYIVEEDTEQEMQQVELLNLDLLRPALVRSLQAALVAHPDWVISVRVEGSDGERRIGMGLMICSDKVVDDLRREFLPGKFREMRFE